MKWRGNSWSNIFRKRARKSKHDLTFTEKRKSGNGGERGNCRKKWAENNEQDKRRQ